MLNATLTLAHRNIETQVQMAEMRATLNEVVQAAAHYSENCTEYTTPETDGGAGMAFDNTIIKILDRIDRLIGDDTRWKPDKVARREADREARDRTENMAEQTKYLKYNNRPVVRMNAVVVPHQGVYVVQAPFGDGTALSGVGTTIPEAMDRFDHAFHTRPAPPPEPPAETPPAPARRPRKGRGA